MNDMELLEQSKNNIQQVFERMTEVESLGELKKSVEVGQLGIVMSDGGVISLNILSDSQVNAAKDCIIKLVDDNLTDARKFLSKFNLLANMPVIVPQDAELPPTTSENEKEDETINEVESSLKIENTEPNAEPKKPELDCSKENLYKLYITEGRTVKDICAEYDINTQKLYKELGKYGLVDLKKTKRLDAKYRP